MSADIVPSSITVFSHVRKVALDLEKTGLFYSQIFCFELEWEQATEGESPFLPLTEIAPPVSSRVRMYRKGDFRLEISCYDQPLPLGSTERLPMNELAMTHISFRVSSLEATLGLVRQFGGQVLASTHVSHPLTGDYIMCLDPDGFRVELMPMAIMPRRPVRIFDDTGT